MNKSRATAESGFSLVELMVAVAIIAIALVSLISVIVTNIKLDDMTRELIVATNAANLELERLRGVNYNTGIRDLLVGGAYQEDFAVRGLRLLPPASDPRKKTADLPGYIDIRSEAGSDDNIVDIRVFVDWLGADGNTKTVELVSKRSDRGVNKP